jgi:hypothetical protein
MLIPGNGVRWQAAMACSAVAVTPGQVTRSQDAVIRT